MSIVSYFCVDVGAEKYIIKVYHLGKLIYSPNNDFRLLDLLISYISDFRKEERVVEFVFSFLLV